MNLSNEENADNYNLYHELTPSTKKASYYGIPVFLFLMLPALSLLCVFTVVRLTSRDPTAYGYLASALFFFSAALLNHIRYYQEYATYKEFVKNSIVTEGTINGGYFETRGDQPADYFVVVEFGENLGRHKSHSLFTRSSIGDKATVRHHSKNPLIFELLD